MFLSSEEADLTFYWKQLKKSELMDNERARFYLNFMGFKHLKAEWMKKTKGLDKMDDEAKKLSFTSFFHTFISKHIVKFPTEKEDEHVS